MHFCVWLYYLAPYSWMKRYIKCLVVWLAKSVLSALLNLLLRVANSSIWLHCTHKMLWTPPIYLLTCLCINQALMKNWVYCILLNSRKFFLHGQPSHRYLFCLALLFHVIKCAIHQSVKSRVRDAAERFRRGISMSTSSDASRDSATIQESSSVGFC